MDEPAQLLRRSPVRSPASAQGIRTPGAEGPTDFSPRGDQMRLLAQLMHSGPAAAGRRDALRGMFGDAVRLPQIHSSPPPVVQAKALENSRLNVAGESHPDMATQPGRQRRADEKRYALATASGPYWTESEFSYTVEQISFFMFKSKKTLRGDPAILRLEQNMSILKDSLGAIAFYLAPASAPDPVIQAEQLSLWSGLAKNLSGRARQSTAEVVGLLGSPEEMEKYAVKLLPFTAKSQAAAAKFAALEVVTSQDEMSANAAEALVVTKDLVAEFESTIRAVRAFDTISEDRSKQMNTAAASAAKQTGLWKIGNNHVNHIIADDRIDKSTLPYNLMSKTEFDAAPGFTDWVAANPGPAVA